MVTRIINGIEIDIDESLANEIYFTQEFIDSIPDFSDDIDQIKNSIYSWKNKNEYLPLSIMWELTNSCNFSCPFCYINTPLAKRHPFYSFDEFKKTADMLIDMGMLFCTLSGGECLIQPNFIDFYSYLKKRGVIVSIFTNGLLINNDMLKIFKEYKPYKIEVSIYGFSDEGFKSATKTNYDYTDVLKNILKLKELGIDIRCKTPITKLTSLEIPSIKNWCDENNIFYYVSDELLDSYYGENVDNYRTTDTISHNKETSYLKQSSNKFGRKTAWNCSGGKYAGVISADRFFYPCMASVGLNQYRYSIADGIDNAISQFKETLNVEKGKYLVFCQGCNYCDTCPKCVLSIATDSLQQLSAHCKQWNI